MTTVTWFLQQQRDFSGSLVWVKGGRFNRPQVDFRHRQEHRKGHGVVAGGTNLADYNRRYDSKNFTPLPLLILHLCSSFTKSSLHQLKAV